MTIDTQFNRLNEKLQLLLKQQARLRRENEQLKSLLEQQKTQQALSLQVIDQLEQQMSILKLAAGAMSDADKKAFEKRLNQYLKDIDKCIAFLGQ